MRDPTDARVPKAARFALSTIADQIEALIEQIDKLEREIVAGAKRDEDMRRLATIPGVERHAFGRPIGEHEGVSFMLADNEMDIHVARLATWHAAWQLDQGKKAANESSMAKVICSEAVQRAVDRAFQVLGGLGTTRDTIVERIYRDVRAFRIYDGPSEVHRWALGRRIVSGKL